MSCIDSMQLSVSKEHKAVVNIYHPTFVFPLHRLFTLATISVKIYCVLNYELSKKTTTICFARVYLTIILIRNILSSDK